MIFRHQTIQTNSPVGFWPIINKRKDLQQLLNAKSNNQIDRALAYIDMMASKNFKKWIEKIGKEKKGQVAKEKKKQEDAENPHLKYDLGGNIIHLRLKDGTIAYWCDYRSWRESMSEWGQPLVIDMSWFKTMRFVEQKSLMFR